MDVPAGMAGSSFVKVQIQFRGFCTINSDSPPFLLHQKEKIIFSLYGLEGIDLKATQEFPFLENFVSKIYLNSPAGKNFFFGLSITGGCVKIS